MKTSNTIDKIAEALASAQSQMKGASKDSINPAFKSKYADLSSVIDACRPALSSNGIAYSQSLEKNGDDYTMKTILMHKSGEFIEYFFPVVLPEMKGNVGQLMQVLGSVCSYARRYSLMSAVGIAMDDDDGEAAKQVEAAPKPDSAEFFKYLTVLKGYIATKDLPDHLLDFGRLKSTETGLKGHQVLKMFCDSKDQFMEDYEEYLAKRS